MNATGSDSEGWAASGQVSVWEEGLGGPGCSGRGGAYYPCPKAGHLPLPFPPLLARTMPPPPHYGCAPEFGAGQARIKR